MQNNAEEAHGREQEQPT